MEERTVVVSRPLRLVYVRDLIPSVSLPTFIFDTFIFYCSSSDHVL